MTPFVFNTSASLVFEPGASRRLGALLSERVGPRPLFVTDPGLRRLRLCDPAITSLTDAGAELTIFDAVEADPSRATLNAAVEAGRKADATGVIGFGGGSSMDVAKLAALLLGLGRGPGRRPGASATR